MELKQLIKSYKNHKRIFWSIIGSVLLLSFIITIVQPLKFGTESQVLVSQKMGASTDLYTMSKSNAYLSSSLAKVVSSNAFFNDTMNTDFGIDKAYFTSDLKEQIKIWRKTVDASALSDSGIVIINVYHTDRYQANQIARAINYTLREKGGNYVNSGSGLYVRVLDEPTVSSWPVKPNIIINTISGLLLGFGIAMFYIYLVADEKVISTGNNSYESSTHVISVAKETVVPVAPIKANPIIDSAPVNPPVPKPTIEPVRTIAPDVPEEKAIQDLVKGGDINNVF